MWVDDLPHFFNPDEFAVMALIQNNRVLGILESATLTLNHVQCVQFKFTCAQAAVSKVKLNDEVKMANQPYRILEMKPDGTGLVHLLLEAT